MIAVDIHRIDLDMKELQAHLERARSVLGEDGYGKLTAALETLAYLTDLVGDKDTTIHRLQQIIFGASTEKTRNVLENQTEAAVASSEKNADQEKSSAEDNKEKPKGHGRNGAQDYTGAQRVKVAHESLKPGDHCPLCRKGKVYAQKIPAYIVRLVGRSPLGATVYEMENLRCNLCLEVFTAAPPRWRGTGKVRPDGGSDDDRALEIREWLPLPSTRTSAGEHGNSVAGFHPMGDRSGDLPSNISRLQGIDTTGSSGRSALQRRYGNENPGSDGEKGQTKAACRIL